MSHFITKVHIVSHPCSHNEPLFSKLFKLSNYGSMARSQPPHHHNHHQSVGSGGGGGTGLGANDGGGHAKDQKTYFDCTHVLKAFLFITL